MAVLLAIFDHLCHAGPVTQSPMRELRSSKQTEPECGRPQFMSRRFEKEGVLVEGFLDVTDYERVADDAFGRYWNEVVGGPVTTGSVQLDLWRIPRNALVDSIRSGGNLRAVYGRLTRERYSYVEYYLPPKKEEEKGDSVTIVTEKLLHEKPKSATFQLYYLAPAGHPKCLPSNDVFESFEPIRGNGFVIDLVRSEQSSICLALEVNPKPISRYQVQIGNPNQTMSDSSKNTWDVLRATDLKSGRQLASYRGAGFGSENFGVVDCSDTVKASSFLTGVFKPSKRRIFQSSKFRYQGSAVERFHRQN